MKVSNCLNCLLIFALVIFLFSCGDIGGTPGEVIPVTGTPGSGNVASCVATINKNNLDGHLFPAANSRDMIYNARNYTLYISNGTEILQYDTATGALLDTISSGGELRGLDINSICSQIAVADDTVVNSTVSIHLIDTQTHSISDLSFPAAFSESGTYSVAYTSDNNLVSTSEIGGSGDVPLRHIDVISTDVIYQYLVSDGTILSANPDDSLIAFPETGTSAGPYGVYDYNSMSMTTTGNVNAPIYDIAIDRTSSFLAIPTYRDLRIYDMSDNLITTIPSSIYGEPLGVAYNPVKDLLYVSWAGSSTVTVFDSLTQVFIENINTPYSLGWNGNWGMEDGHIKISDDGTQAFIQVPGGIYSFRI